MFGSDGLKQSGQVRTQNLSHCVPLTTMDIILADGFLEMFDFYVHENR